MFRQDRLAKEGHVLARCGQVWQDRPVSAGSGLEWIGVLWYGSYGGHRQDEEWLVVARQIQDRLVMARCVRQGLEG